MPSTSKAQLRLFQMVHAYKKGELPDASKEVKDLAASLTDEQVGHYTSTPEKGLPERAKKAMTNSERLQLGLVKAAIAGDFRLKAMKDAPALARAVGNTHIPMLAMPTLGGELVGAGAGIARGASKPFGLGKILNSTLLGPHYEGAISSAPSSALDSMFRKLPMPGVSSDLTHLISNPTPYQTEARDRVAQTVKRFRAEQGFKNQVQGLEDAGSPFSDLFHPTAAAPVTLPASSSWGTAASRQWTPGIGEKAAGISDDAVDMARRIAEGKQLQDMAEANRGRLPAAEDVLQGASAAIPHGALRVGAGGLAGAGAGELLGTLFSQPITDDMPNGQADEIRSKRHRVARLGAILGLIGSGVHEYGADLKPHFAM